MRRIADEFAGVEHLKIGNIDALGTMPVSLDFSMAHVRYVLVLLAESTNLDLEQINDTEHEFSVAPESLDNGSRAQADTLTEIPARRPDTTSDVIGSFPDLVPAVEPSTIKFRIWRSTRSRTNAGKRQL